MLPESTKIFSADDHVIEPPNTWVDRVPAAYRDTCPRIIDVDGRQAWLYEGEVAHIPMGSCRALPDHPEYGYPPAPGTANFDEIRPGCYDPVERLKDMDIDGMWGQVIFPNYARFAGHRFFLGDKDPVLGLVCLKAYNDFLFDTWCATAPDRLHGAAILPLNDVDAAVVELKRVIDKGAKAIAFSENPTVLGLPSVHTAHWDPIWAVAAEAGVTVCTHIGSSSRLMTTSADAPPTVLVSLIGVNSMMTSVDWLFSGIFDRFPGLKLILSEGGAGWIPYILEKSDKAFHDGRISRNDQIGQGGSQSVRPPTEIFREHMYVCLVDERFALKSLEHIPVDNLLFEGDYPHGDGLWPNNRTYLEKALADVPDDIAVKIAGGTLQSLLKV